MRSPGMMMVVVVAVAVGAAMARPQRRTNPPRVNHKCSRIHTGHAVVGDAVETMIGVASTDVCARACIKHQDCAAFSYGVLATRECALHRAPVRLRQSTGWVVGICGADDVVASGSPRSGDLPMLPGMDYFEKGIEAIQDVINRSNHIRLPVYAWTQRLQHSWYNPETQQTYAIPDQISFTENMAGYEQIDDLYTQTYTETITEQTNSFSFGGSVGINYAGIGASVSYSENKQWYNYNDEVKQKSNYVSHSLMWFKFFETMAYPIEVLGADALDPMFVHYVSTLPPKITNASDLAAYEFFVANWGTHYIKWANFGGRLQLDIFTDSTFTSDMSASWLSTQHSLQFHFTLYAIDVSAQTAGFHNKSQIHRNSSFLNHSRTYLYYEGGNPAFMDTDNLVAWKDSVAATPHWLNVTLQPFHTLPMLTPEQQGTLWNFTSAYLKRNTVDPPPSPPPPPSTA
mmetsp:Transcript_36195/g.108669  ORF Transcript_36195/g.108669 Transcript_36195/m.108669 type:complete len:457 (+) Transcript_36195:36-1406(+)